LKKLANYDKSQESCDQRKQILFSSIKLNKDLMELGTNPLNLTLICIVFSDDDIKLEN
jgi:hypothetical protein